MIGSRRLKLIMTVLALTAATSACSMFERAAARDMPRMSASGAPKGMYLVAPGDTVFGIARKHGVTKEAIRDANNLDGAYRISSGQLLRIPGPGQRAVNQRSVVAQPLVSAPARRQITPPPSKPASKRSVAAFGRIQPLQPPVNGEVVAPFGRLANGTQNDGVDISAPTGSPVVVAEDGEIAFISDPTSALGSVMLVQHANNLVTVYGRINQVNVRVRQRVRRGDVIARVAPPRGGGLSTLHFELRQGADAVDPAPYL